ncbi:unnamed protein product [Symbiodinium sp. KB8]|nr:unnamed protein product [Symbiodinium sp. KB8]
MDEERRERVGRDFLVYFNYTVMTRIVVWVLFGALLYDLKATTPLRTEMRQQSRDSSSQNNFAFGLCECCHHCETSCWAIWCPCALWSATASSPKSNFGGWSFWQLTFLWVGFYLLSGTAGAMEAFLEILPALSLPLLLIRICIQVWHRQHLRKKCDLDHGNCCTLTEDACVWCFCTQCAAMQEALQVGFVEGMPLTGGWATGLPSSLRRKPALGSLGTCFEQCWLTYPAFTAFSLCKARDSHELDAPERSTTRELPFLGGGATAWLPTSETDVDLTHELERVRKQARRRGVGPSSTLDGQAKGGPQLMLGALTEKRLQELKRKFLLPFASQRQVNGKLVVVPWMPRPPVGLKVPEGHLRQARVPVKASVEDIKKASTRLVKGQLPLELLTRQPNPALLASVRAQMQSTDMVRLVGLLSHWLYWNILDHERRLQPGKMQALVISIQEAWAAAILTFLETPAGVAFAIPALLVTAKMLIEVIFRAQYEDVLRAENNSLQLIEEINMMCMSLLDTDCTFAHFAALDALSEGTKLWRKLQARL